MSYAECFWGMAYSCANICESEENPNGKVAFLLSFKADIHPSEAKFLLQLCSLSARFSFIGTYKRRKVNVRTREGQALNIHMFCSRSLGYFYPQSGFWLYLVLRLSKKP